MSDASYSRIQIPDTTNDFNPGHRLPGQAFGLQEKPQIPTSPPSAQDIVRMKQLDAGVMRTLAAQANLAITTSENFSPLATHSDTTQESASPHQAGPQIVIQCRPIDPSVYQDYDPKASRIVTQQMLKAASQEDNVIAWNKDAQDLLKRLKELRSNRFVQKKVESELKGATDLSKRISICERLIVIPLI